VGNGDGDNVQGASDGPFQCRRYQRKQGADESL
jgi:hypothetical protein